MMRTQDSLPNRTLANLVLPGRMSMFFMAGFQQLAASGSALDDLFLSEAEEGGKKINFLAFLVFLRDWTATRFDLPERAANQMEDIVIFSSAVFISPADVLDSRFNSIHPEGQGYHLTLTNPPFSGTVHPQLLPASLSWLKGSLKTETLFVARVLQLLETGGRAAIALPNGICFRSNKGYLELRRRLLQENQIEAIISLPGGIFDPYSGIAIQILVFRRGGQTESVWFYEVETMEKDWGDLLLKYALHQGASRPSFVDAETWQRWQAWSPGERSEHHACIRTDGGVRTIETLELPATRLRDWVTSLAHILEIDNLNLSPGRHKPFIPVQEDYPHPLECLRDLIETEVKISQGTAKLYEMLLTLYSPDDPQGRELLGAMMAAEVERQKAAENLQQTMVAFYGLTDQQPDEVPQPAALL